MSRARDLANLADEATGLATDSEVSAAVAAIDLTNVQRIVPVDSNISVPGAPTSVSASAGDTEATVSFVAPTSNGGSTILSYTVISSPGNIKKSGTSSPITITGLTNGTAYTFTVKAHNIAGSSVASSASSSITPIASVTVDYLVVAGGGGGSYNGASSGGGGAGGTRCTVGATGGGGTLESALGLLVGTNYTVTVGAGGTSIYNGNSGSNSVFSTITSTGGGWGSTDGGQGATGGSGGGGSTNGGLSNGNGGAGTANQGYAGGAGFGYGSSSTRVYLGGGGGGAGAAGTAAVSGTAGVGGNGITTSISGTSTTYAGGGGGSSGRESSGADVNGGAGGTGGGGAGGTRAAGTAGTANTGGGGGGGGFLVPTYYTGGQGGSGIVILKYPDTKTITIGAGLTGSTASPSGGFKVTTLTAGTGNVSWA